MAGIDAMQKSKERSLRCILSMCFVLTALPAEAKEAPPIDNRIYNCDYLVREHKDMQVIMVLGDSNIVTGELPAAPKLAAVFNVNPINGLCYPVREPMMGTIANHGSPWVRLANALVESNAQKEVLLVPVTLPSSNIADWKKDGPVFVRLQNMLAALKKQEITVHAVLWQHGQKNDEHITQKDQYQTSFADIVESLRSNGTTAPIYVAKTGSCPGKASGLVWEAQAAIMGSAPDVLAGPDLSRLSPEHFNADQCALNEKGLDAYVQQWHSTLTQK